MYKKMSSSLLYLSLTTQFYSVLSNMLPVYMNKTQHNNNAMKKIIFYSVVISGTPPLWS